MRTGHCGVNYYLWRFKKVESAECEMCGYEKETVEHFLVECPSFWKERYELKKKIGTGRMSLAILLGDKEAVRATMEYISMTGRFISLISFSFVQLSSRAGCDVTWGSRLGNSGGTVT